MHTTALCTQRVLQRQPVSSLGRGRGFLIVWSLALLILFAFPRESHAQVAQQDSMALVALYTATGGGNWMVSESFTGPVATWWGITVEDGRVTELELPSHNLKGSLPPQLGQLTGLQSLKLSSNDLTGAIPPELGQLSNLTELDLSSNELTGALPSELGRLSKLSSLRLNRNQLTGSIPPALGDLSNLISLYLSANQFTGALPKELGQLSRLQSLHFSTNQLAGAMPAALNNLSSLVDVDASENPDLCQQKDTFSGRFVFWFSTIPTCEDTAARELEIDFIDAYDEVWNDRGSGAAQDVSFWRPTTPEGWHRVGHHAKSGYDTPTASTMIVKASASGMLAAPSDYTLIWDDAGSGVTQDGSVWRPVCPGGYQALGDVASGSHDKPSLDEVRCVKESALVKARAGDAIWNDAGSGAQADFAAWGIEAPKGRSGGLFYGAASHVRPADDEVEVLWAIPRK